MKFKDSSPFTRQGSNRYLIINYTQGHLLLTNLRSSPLTSKNNKIITELLKNFHLTHRDVKIIILWHSLFTSPAPIRSSPSPSLFQFGFFL